jgi:hypothetical protein
MQLVPLRGGAAQRIAAVDEEEEAAGQSGGVLADDVNADDVNAAVAVAINGAGLLTSRAIPSVGLVEISLYPRELESAWFQPLSLYKVKNWFQNLQLQIQLVPQLHTGRAPGQLAPSHGRGGSRGVLAVVRGTGTQPNPGG